MAAKLYDLQLAGFTSVGVPSTGAGLIGFKAIELWDDGSLKFVDASLNKIAINESPEFNRLLTLLIQGGAGVSAVKKFHK